jgi:hypothetical protein
MDFKVYLIEKRASDVYVFSVYTESNPKKANVLDMSKWQFYVLLTSLIDKELGEQKTVGLKRIAKMCESFEYRSLKKRIDFSLRSE